MKDRRQNENRRQFQDGDCYGVTRNEDGSFLVEHFPNWRQGARACCRVKVRVTEADRPANRTREQIEADPYGEVAALHRSYLAIEKKHAATAAAAPEEATA